MTSSELTEGLLTAGLVQFGTFGAEASPVKINAGLLSSYPQVLKTLAVAATETITGVDRLVCTADSIPFGMAVSLHMDIPLVYSLGTDASGVHDLIGAYDVGHPAALLVNIWQDAAGIQRLIDKAVRVGLEINQVVAVFGVMPPPQSLSYTALVHLPAWVDKLTAASRLPTGQAQAVKAWIANLSTD